MVMSRSFLARQFDRNRCGRVSYGGAMKKRPRISPRSLVESDPLAPDHFTWQVAPNGYRWEERRCFRRNSNEKPHERTVLSPPHPGELTRDYNPLAVPQLFRTFADTGFGKDDALRFVNEFGLLGLKKWELQDRMEGLRSVYCELLG